MKRKESRYMSQLERALTATQQTLALQHSFDDDNVEFLDVEDLTQAIEWVHANTYNMIV